MTWDNITVKQYQSIYKIAQSDMNEFDAAIQVFSILTGNTEDEINEMPKIEFDKQSNEISALLSAPIPGKPKNFIKANGKRYNLIYNIEHIKQRQYAEVKYFLQGGVIENLHYIVGSIVRPVKFLRIQENKAEDALLYAADLLKAKFTDVYNAAVFFYQLYKGSIASLKTLLEQEMSRTMRKEQAEEAFQLLIKNLDGFITVPLSLNMKG